MRVTIGRLDAGDRPAATVDEIWKRLRRALRSRTPAGPGRWVAWADESTVELRYEMVAHADPATCACGSYPCQGCHGDEPWRIWGGDELVRAAGLDTAEPSEVGTDYDADTGRHAQWAAWEFGE